MKYLLLLVSCVSLSAICQDQIMDNDEQVIAEPQSFETSLADLAKKIKKVKGPDGKIYYRADKPKKSGPVFHYRFYGEGEDEKIQKPKFIYSNQEEVADPDYDAEENAEE